MPLTNLTPNALADANQVNANFALCVLTDTIRTIAVTHEWNASQNFNAGIDVAGGALKVGGTEVISSNRELLAVGLAINAQTGTAYTPVLSDAGKVVHLTNASPITFTVPPNSSVPYAVGTVIGLYQGGAGQVTVAPGSGVTIRSFDNVLTLVGRYAEATIRKIATNEWVLAGLLG